LIEVPDISSFHKRIWKFLKKKRIGFLPNLNPIIVIFFLPNFVFPLVGKKAKFSEKNMGESESW
jgi:hypothetical protein